MDGQNPLDEIGPLIYRRRMRRGISQAALADRVGIAQGYLSELEKAKKHPTLTVLLAISRELRYPLGDLFSDAEELSRPVLRPQVDPFE